MSPEASGLQRDLNLVRRRWWLFLPFLLLGVLAAVGFNSFAGQTNAVALLELDTVIHDAGLADRGLRIFEAQSMTDDEEFIAAVKAEIGDEDFDYSRYDVSLFPISVAAGISRGELTISIKDDDKGKAEELRQAFLNVFIPAYEKPDGLMRTRFIDSTTRVAVQAQGDFETAYAELSALAEAEGVPIDELYRADQETNPLDALNQEQAELRRSLGEVEGAATAISGLSATAAAAVASGVVGAEVAPGDAADVLEGRRVSLEAALERVGNRISQLSDGNLSPELLARLDEVRGLDMVKRSAADRLANARVAVRGSESTYQLEETFSGGLAGSLVGQVAVVLAVTLVFGLIAVYGVEWLSQVRQGSE